MPGNIIVADGRNNMINPVTIPFTIQPVPPVIGVFAVKRKPSPKKMPPPLEVASS